MYRAGIVGAVLAATLAVPSAQALPPETIETLDRVGPWDVHYSDDYCDLLAEFGKGDRNVIVDFRRFGPNDAFDFTLYGKRFASAEPQNDAKLDFGIGTPARLQALGGNLNKLPMVIFNGVGLGGQHSAGSEPSPITPEIEAAVTGVTVWVAGVRRFHLNFGSLAKPFATLRVCETDLLKRWGFDPDLLSHLSSGPRPKTAPQTWLHSSDYPDRMVWEGVNALVQFRLDISDQGEVAACHILFRTNGDAFADTTCKAISTRAKFDPALDASGKPVRAPYVAKVIWRVGD